MSRKIRAEKVVEEKVVNSDNGFLDAISEVATTKEGASKKDKMTSLTPPIELRKSIDEIVKWKQKEKEAKAEKEALEVDVLDWAKGRQDEEAFNGNFQKSYRIQGIKEVVTFVSSDKFSVIKPEDLTALREALGQRTDDLIEKQTSVMLRDEVVSGPKSQELQAELMGLFKTVYGDSYKEKFQAFFRSETVFKTVDGFDRKIFSFSKKIVERVRELVKQTKSSLK
jgi:hypothetical protein